MQLIGPNKDKEESYAQQINHVTRMHLLYCTILLFTEIIDKFKDQRIKAIMESLGKVFCLQEVSLSSDSLYD